MSYKKGFYNFIRISKGCCESVHSDPPSVELLPPAPEHTQEKIWMWLWSMKRIDVVGG